MRGSFHVAAGWFVLVCNAAGSIAQVAGQGFVPPPNSLSFEDTGSLEVYRDGFLQIRDSKTDVWVLKILPETTVIVEGVAEVGYLRPGLNVQLDAKIDKNFAIKEPIDAIELLTVQGKPSLGLFAAGDKADDTRPVRNPGPGSYRIRGRFASLKGDQVIISIGSRRIAGTLADDVKIKFTSDDPSVADVGDSVKMKAWYTDSSKPIPAVNIPGKAYAEEISITLAKPLAPTGRRARQSERAAKPPAKEAKEKTANGNR